MSDIEHYVAKEDTVAVPDAVFDGSGRMILPNENGQRLFIRGGAEDIDINAIFSDALRTGVILDGHENRRLSIGRLATIGIGVAIGVTAFETHESAVGGVSAFMITFGLGRIFRK